MVVVDTAAGAIGAAGTLTFGTNNTAALTLTATQSVGIGTTSPTSNLTIIANTSNSGNEGAKHGLAIRTSTNGQTLDVGYDGTADIGYVNVSKTGSTKTLV